MKNTWIFFVITPPTGLRSSQNLHHFSHLTASQLSPSGEHEGRAQQRPLGSPSLRSAKAGGHCAACTLCGPLRSPALLPRLLHDVFSAYDTSSTRWGGNRPAEEVVEEDPLVLSQQHRAAAITIIIMRGPPGGFCCSTAQAAKQKAGIRTRRIQDPEGRGGGRHRRSNTSAWHRLLGAPFPSGNSRPPPQPHPFFSGVAPSLINFLSPLFPLSSPLCTKHPLPLPPPPHAHQLQRAGNCLRASPAAAQLPAKCPTSFVFFFEQEIGVLDHVRDRQREGQTVGGRDRDRG